ncbi:MAG: iron-containing alcohol dehydrogenase [Chlamydiae bacterium]|nr:iron-containing alcohol dehydrogenase [Chlamydiota bacterium]
MPHTVIIHAKSVRTHLDKLEKWGLSGTAFEIDGVETDKSIECYLKIIDFLTENNFKRSDLLVAFGGGALLDLVGFVAATYMRGVDVIFVPTTLLAMVDASIGGKNGLNRPWAKNIIGTTYLPKKTVIDIEFLSTLPEDQLYSGYVEMVKIAALSDDGFLQKLHYPPTLEMIDQARQLKEEIVKEDLLDHGKRALLNFGHTVGHALEVLNKFKMHHGEAVQHGIQVEMELLNAPDDFIQTVGKKLPYNKKIPSVETDAFLSALKKDKKNLGEKIGISNPFYRQGGGYIRYFSVNDVLDAYLRVLVS